MAGNTEITSINDGTPGFRITRYYSIASLVCIVVATVLIVSLYRHEAINGITKMGERSNRILAQTTLDLVKPELVAFLDKVAYLEEADPADLLLTPEVERALQEVMSNNAVVRVKLYNNLGTVVFSTKTRQIGRNQGDNPAVVSALNGMVASKLLFRDAFSLTQDRREEDNLVQSYLPVRDSATAPIMGVFEIYTDVSPMVAELERTETVVLLGSALILLALYAVLLLVVRRADSVIQRQQQTITERTRALEVLSSQLLTAQEDEKKRLAEYLHEDLAQTLSAIMLSLKNACKPNGDAEEYAGTSVQDKLIEITRNAISQVRSTAMRLRPPSLDDFGLVPTVAWFVRDLQSVYPDLGVETQVNLGEGDVPRPLKIIVYRIIQEVLEDIAKRGEADSVQVRLHKDETAITLDIEDNGAAYHAVAEEETGRAEDRAALIYLKERTALSGGTYVIDRNREGGTLTRASWHAAV